MIKTNLRAEIERRENETLSRYAMRSSESQGRVRPEEPDSVRTAFQRDRDRILHSKAFRRLKHKTQVFIDPQGDHYRTRMTHTLEVSQVARTIGRALALNEDLIEAIALGHDVGHPPFGHAGEAALDEAVSEIAGGPAEFRHYDQSLRVVDILEPLNLTHEVRMGIMGHSKGRKDLAVEDGIPTSTMEAAVVRVADRIAYLNHDLDDALRSGIIRELPSELSHLGMRHGARVGMMVEDLLESSRDTDTVSLSPSMLKSMNLLKEWLFEEVYTKYPVLYPDINKAKRMVKMIFMDYVASGAPDGFDGVQGALDYVAGMTDRFAIREFKSRFLPSTFRSESE